MSVTALGFGVTELFYFTVIAFFVLYATRTVGFSASQANELKVYFFVGVVIGLVVFGWLGDRYRKRQAFILHGALVSMAALVWWVLRVPDTSLVPQGWLLFLIGCAGAASLSNWLGGFTDLLDRNNPASVARGFAIWAAAVQIAVVITLISVAALEPNLGTAARSASPESLAHWKTWWWVCVAGRVLFLPTIALLPRQRRRDEVIVSPLVEISAD